MSRTPQGHPPRAVRGATLVEVLATSTILLLGLGGAMMALGATSRQNRNTLSVAQAHAIAERELERFRAMGCTSPNLANPCANLSALDGDTSTVWQTADGPPLPSAPAVPARRYDVAVDVDPPTESPGETGAPALDRVLASGSPGSIVNVRVSVSWQEPGTSGERVVVLQTRVAP